MATANEIRKQLDIVQNIEYDIGDAKRACRALEEMYQMDKPEDWSWIVIHSSDSVGEIRIDGGSHPNVTRGFMKQMIEDYYIEPLRTELAAARAKLRDMVSEDCTV